MAVERIDLAGSSSLEPTAPVSSAPAVQAQVSARQEEGKPRRRLPAEEALAKAMQDENNVEDENEAGKNSGEEQSPHRLDDLA
jgi:hypothetical protein